jgi:hypothetical protein
MPLPTLNFDQLAAKFDGLDPAYLAEMLEAHRQQFQPDGWFIAECSRRGELVLLPYGGNATHKVVPDKPFSPRGLASDSVAIACFPNCVSYD